MATPLTDIGSFVASITGLQDILNDVNKNFLNVKKDYTSIASRAAESILQCPVVCSKSIDYETAMLVTKACERYYADFAIKVMSLSPSMGNSKSDAIDFIRQFHQNEQGPKQIVGLNRETFESWKVADVTLTQNNVKGSQAFIESTLPFDADLNTESLNNMVGHSSIADCKNVFGIPVREAKNDHKGYKKNDKSYPYRDKYENNSTHSYDYSKTKDNSVTNNVTNNDYSNKRPVEYTLPRDVLMNNDVKKANELQPTNFTIKFVRPNAKGDDTTFELIIGVKCALHEVPSVDIVAGLVDACEYKGTLYNFIKFTTGETQFFRDFLLRMDELNKDVVDKELSKSKWIPHLKELARKAKSSNAFSHSRYPNATIVVNQDEVDYIKANYNYDLNNPSMAARVMKTFFLLSFIIVDPGSEIVNIATDGINGGRYQTYTYKALERDNDSAERQFKQILRAVNKL